MKLTICAIGKAKDAAIQQLLEPYKLRGDWQLQLLEKAPKSLPDKRKQMQDEAEQLRQMAQGAHRRVLLDRQGRMLSSPDIAAQLQQWQGQGAGHVAFWLGGAEGADPALRQEADAIWSFGPATWPHMLARVMLAEQLFRAWAIVHWHPYHRD